MAKSAAKTASASRRGKRAWVTYLDPDTSRPLQAAATMADRSPQSLGVRGCRSVDRAIRDALAFIAW